MVCFRKRPHASHGGTGEDGMTDPVCGMTVEPETAATAWEVDGTVYYFCSTGCMERFRADPARFLTMDPSERQM